MSALFMMGAFGEIPNQDLLSEVMYEAAPATPRTVFSKQDDPRRATKGRFRLENILRRTRLSRREAEFFHKALRYSLGEAVAERIPADRLASMSLADFRGALLTHGASAPADSSPERRLHVLATKTASEDLNLGVAFMDAHRLGGGKGSPWLAAITLGDMPSHEIGQRYSLDIAGLKDGDDLLIIEASREVVTLDDGRSGQIFPVAFLPCCGGGVQVEAQDGPFVTGAAQGVFSYFAFTGDLSPLRAWEDRFKSAPEPFDDLVCDQFIRALETVAGENRRGLRAAHYSYVVR